MSRNVDVRPPLGGATVSRANQGEREQSRGSRDIPRGSRSGTGRPRQDRQPDVHDALTQQLALPRGNNRERVGLDGRELSLRGSEVRTLATVGAFRIVDARDLESRAKDPWHGDLDHLRRERLIQVKSYVLDGERTALVTLTTRGRELLEQHRQTDATERAQAFYSGLVKPREATHDAQLARVYATAAERLHEQVARIQRVVLDYELKREYQQFLQDNNRGESRSSGRSNRSADEIQAWADEHHLPTVDGHVQFPDVRIEYEHPDGRPDREDLELATGHYNSRQMAAKQATGFSIQRSDASRFGGVKSRRGGTPFDPRTAEKVLR